MNNVRSFLLRWWPLLAFAAFWLALRVFWIAGDPGVPSIWEYGFNVTDEGYYMGAGKDKLLRGVFCDLACGESFTYGYSALTHWLAYVGYRLFGLRDWGWRVPFVALYLLSWVLSFLYVARRQSPRFALILLSVLSAVPVMVAYERTACNDLTIGALSVIAFVIASGKGVWRIFTSAAVLGAVSIVKPSVWVLLPIVSAGVLSERKTRAVWIDIVLFVIAAVVSVWCWRGLAVLSLLPEAGLHGLSASEIIRRTTTHNGLPSLTDINLFLRGFSSFPREICFTAMGPLALLVSLVPLTMAVRQVVYRMFNWRMLLFLSVAAYVASVSVLNSICLHYYHPALMLLPILCSEVQSEWGNVLDSEKREGRSLALTLALVAGAVVVGFLFLLPVKVNPKELIGFFSTISNLPQKIVWAVDGWACVGTGVATFGLLAVRRGLTAARREGWAWASLGTIGASVALAGIPVGLVAPYVRRSAFGYVPTSILLMIVTLSFLLLSFGDWRGRLASACCRWFAPAVVLLGFAVSPVWRSAALELTEGPHHVQRQVADEVSRHLPSNAVVIGERARQVLMAKPFRTATTMPGCDPIPIVKQLLEKEPTTPLYALTDSQNAYNLQHFREHANEFRLDCLKVFKMPSFMTGKPADVYLCRIQPLKNPMTK